MIFDLVVDHPVAGAAVAAGAAGSGDGRARVSARSDRSFNLGFRDAEANADVHPVLKIMKPVFIIKGDRGVFAA